MQLHIKLEPETTTRSHNYKIKKPLTNRRVRQNYLVERAGNTWNADTVNAPSLNVFKNRTEKYWTNTIKQIKHLFPHDILKTLYYALVHPHIEYGIIAWGGANSSILRHTVILQKRAMRYIHNSTYNSHTDPLFQIVKHNET